MFPGLCRRHEVQVVKLAASSSTGDIEWLDVRAADGATSQLLLVRAAEPQAPLVVIVPAPGMHGGCSERFAQQLAHRGRPAAAPARGGNGTSNLRASRKVDLGYGHFLELALPAGLEAARRALPEAPLFLLGHSLGGQLVTAYSGLHPEAGHRGL